MKRFTGEIFWIKLEERKGSSPQRAMNGKIERAILNDNTFKIGNKNPDTLPDSEIRLRSKDGFIFDGSAKYLDSPISSAIVSLEYYYNDDKALLMGTWEEDKVEYMCIIKLKEVNSFND